MPARTASVGRLFRDASIELQQPRLWRPAAVLLLPTLLLQLAFPEWLRSRLSPSIWTVIAGSLLIAWLTQVAAAASWGWVDAHRRGRAVRRANLTRAALRVGTLSAAGLLAGLLPGIWAQARLAFLPLQDGGRDRERHAGDRATWPLVWLAAATLLASVLGQSLAAGLAEALGTIESTAVVDGRVQFTLHAAPHVATSVLAYGWTVLALTWQAIGVSIAHGMDAAQSGVTVADRAPRPAQYVVPLRAALVLGAVVMVAGAVAAVQKVQQHLP